MRTAHQAHLSGSDAHQDERSLLEQAHQAERSGVDLYGDAGEITRVDALVGRSLDRDALAEAELEAFGYVSIGLEVTS